MPPVAFEQKSLLKANLAMLRQDNAGAMAEVDILLKSQPKSVHGLTTKGDLLAAQGKDSEALDAYQQAIDLFGKTAEPPVQVLQRYQTLVVKLLKR